ncbi:MAG: prepilin peptidase [Clostridia bacterium]|nr:prepilin peptidase [Clostridia bacterium]
MKILTCIFAFMIFACVGSFIGVCFDRIPKGEKIWRGRSHCDVCGKKLSVLELVPIISFICLRGRCHGCKEKISPVSTFIELATATLGTLMIYIYGLTVQGIAFGLTTAILIEITLLDYKTMEISDLACGLIALSGLALMIWNGSYISSLIGAFCVSVPFLIMALAGGMGLGDAKLMAAVGILLGWKQTLLAAFFGIVIGCIAALILKLKKKRGWKSEIPFGPFLCVGSFLSMLVGEQILSFYLSLL